MSTAELTLTDLRPLVSVAPDFVGEIMAESGIVSVSDSAAFHWAMLPVSGKAAQLSLWRDLLGEPDRAWITIANLNVF